MSIYQRYVSKSLIFVLSIFFLILFFLETNIGFKCFFNFSNYFFIGLKAEEISGNWRDFTLKNISYSILNTSFKANSIHIIINPQSVLKMPITFNKIETKNLIITIKKDKKTILKNNFSKFSILKNTLSFNNSLVLNKIYFDKILLKTQKKNIFLFNVFSGLKAINNTFTIFPTRIDSIYIDSKFFNIKKKIKKRNNNFLIKKDIFYRKKISVFLSSFSIYKKFFIDMNIDLINLKCKKFKFFNKKILNFSKIEISAQLKKNVLKIKNIQIHSKFFRLTSNGTIFFKNDSSIYFLLKNEILTNVFRNKVKKILFKSRINNNFLFNLKSNNLFNFNINGDILLDNLKSPFYINLHVRRFLFPINEKLNFSFKNFNFFLRGKINNYFLSLKNTVVISGIPYFFINLSANGNLKNIFLKKVHFIPFFKNVENKKFIKLKKENNYQKYTSKLIGSINMFGDFNKKFSNISFPYFHLQGDLIRKKISILGSLYYKKSNVIKIPRINFLLGKNKGYISGSISKKINIHSSINANNLSYFMPNLKGVIKSISNVYGFCSLPSFSNFITGNKISWKDIIYLNSIKTLTNVNLKDNISTIFLADIEKIYFFKSYIHSLKIYINWNDANQIFSLLIKDKKLSIKLVLNGSFDKKTGIWKGILKKMDFRSSWGGWIVKNNPLIFYHNSKNTNFYDLKKINKKNIFFSIIDKFKTFLFNKVHQSSVKFRTNLSINTRFQWNLKERISNFNFFLKSNNLKIEKKIKEKIFLEKINFLNIYVNFKKNNFMTKWMIQKLKNSSKRNRISGFLNIYDIFHKNKIESKFFLSNFSCSFLSLFMENFKEIDGNFSGTIKLLGNIYQPEILADINFKDVYIKSDKILKYILLLFHFSPKKIENIKMNQEIIIKKGSLLFTLNSILDKNVSNFKWNVLFNSKKVTVVLFPKIHLNFSSQLNLYYFLSRYDLIGYLKFYLFLFRINEKNFFF